MIARQLSLPGVDMRPTCPLCGRAALLGQYSPLWPHGLCRECSCRHPYPVEIFEHSDKSGDRTGLRIKMDAPDYLREHRIACDQMLKDAVRGYVDDRPIVKFNLSMRELRNPMRRSRHDEYNQMHAHAVKALSVRQISLNFCYRCGGVHDRSYEIMTDAVDYWSTCQRCEDEITVETFWRMRAIFGGDDDETILDRVQRSHPELFERGVLPDYWYQLRGLA
jgi:hypothetical protein